MSQNNILIFICALIIVSYIFDIISKKIKIPSVLLLIGLGIGLKFLAIQFGFVSVDFMVIIPTLGTIGLILIVFEGGLELEYHTDKNHIIRNALVVSIVGLLATALGIAGIFAYFTGETYYRCLLNAIPYSVISSAIAIPSAASLGTKSKSFVTFESSFSDIFGIVFYNYALVYSSISLGVFFNLGVELITVSLLSLAFCVLLLYLLKSIDHHIKFILILTVMILLYAVGKAFHLSSLILVLIFGLMVRNINLIKTEFIQKNFNTEKFKKDFDFMQSITAEGVFLIKTFFFIIFGYIIDVSLLTDEKMLVIAVSSVLAIYFLRLIYLKIFIKHILPEFFYSPRGLISILLYIGLPEEMKIPQLHVGLLFFIVLSTSLVMISSAFVQPQQKEDIQE
ncbi:MAG: cation:proton antiporter [Bacteroidetes bacterium]|jgi:Kef-type K+ transport system membrane component KefB|nr:cation:proton antiporter [Bacteroidota bacterium]